MTTRNNAFKTKIIIQKIYLKNPDFRKNEITTKLIGDKFDLRFNICIILYYNNKGNTY